MQEANTPVRQRLNLIVGVNILFWGAAIFASPDPDVADLAVLSFLTTLALYPWKEQTAEHRNKAESTP